MTTDELAAQVTALRARVEAIEQSLAELAELPAEFAAALRVALAKDLSGD